MIKMTEEKMFEDSLEVDFTKDFDVDFNTQNFSEQEKLDLIQQIIENGNWTFNDIRIQEEVELKASFKIDDEDGSMYDEGFEQMGI